MNIFYVVIFAFQCAVVVVWGKEPKNFSRWILASDFGAHELDNLTPQQEHELQLERFTQKDQVSLGIAFFLEIMATSLGNAFFAFSSSESANRENEAILKAAFECFTKLEYQDRVQKHLENAIRNASVYLNETGDLGAAFSKVCSKMDQDLKNETFYTTARDGFKKQSKSSPAKIYQYGIAKSKEDLRKAFAELTNEPKMKKFIAYSTFVFFARREEVIIQKSIFELASKPDKRELVNKIYETATEEILTSVKDVSPEQVDMDYPVYTNVRELRPILSKKLLSKIDEDPTLKSEFEKIQKRFRDDQLML